jgi:hypothetical protein
MIGWLIRLALKVAKDSADAKQAVQNANGTEEQPACEVEAASKKKHHEQEDAFQEQERAKFVARHCTGKVRHFSLDSAERHAAEMEPVPIQPVNRGNVNKIRIAELSRHLNVKTRDIIERLYHLGFTERYTHASSIPEDQANQIRRSYVREDLMVSVPDSNPPIAEEPVLPIDRLAAWKSKQHPQFSVYKCEVCTAYHVGHSKA